MGTRPAASWFTIREAVYGKVAEALAAAVEAAAQAAFEAWGGPAPIQACASN